MDILVSGISSRDGKKVAYVQFTRDDCVAEAMIPSCEILSNKGFSEQDLKDIDQFLHDNMIRLKNEAAGINPIKAMMKD